MKENMVCPICERGKLNSKSLSEKYHNKMVEFAVLKCNKCTEEFFTIETWKDITRKMIDIVEDSPELKE